MIPDKEWFINLPKTINENGCWISNYAIRIDGYVRFRYKGDIMLLHRASMSAFHDIDYYNYKLESRHGPNCSKACYNPEHLKPGTHYDNMQDAKLEGKFIKDKSPTCPKCGSEYKTKKVKTGFYRGTIYRQCRVCLAERNGARIYTKEIKK